MMSNPCTSIFDFTLGKSPIRLLLGVAFAFSAVFSVTGCGDFFAEKPTAIESRSIINEVDRVRENPNVNNPLPDIYLAPPKKMVVPDGIKLFYFTKHHSANDMAANVEQLGLKVSRNTSTNQLIIHCTDDAQADEVLNYMARVDVPPIQINIDCLILERFGDVTTDWETSILIENFLGEGINIGGDKLSTSGTLSPAFPGASLRETKRGDFGLDFGYWIDKGVSGHQVRLLVDMLESRGYLKVLMNPTLETVNGKEAVVQMRDNAPIQVTVTGKGSGGTTESYSLTKYEWVEDTLKVTPHVFADGFIGLTTSIVVGSKSKPEGIVQNPIITKRTIDVEENRIEPGKSLIIGGIRKSENRSVVRGIPFLKDIPLLGILFSSKDFEEKANEIVFILTPSISSGGVSNAEMVSYVREKHTAPEHEASLTEIITDPLGTGFYTGMVEAEAQKAELELSKSQMDRQSAERLARTQKQRAENAQLQAARLKAQADQAVHEAESAKAEAQKAVELAHVATKHAEEEKAKTSVAFEEKQKAVEEAEKAKAEALQAQQAAAEAFEKAKAAAAQAAQASLEAEKAKTLSRQAAEKLENIQPDPDDQTGTDRQNQTEP